LEIEQGVRLSKEQDAQASSVMLASLPALLMRLFSGGVRRGVIYIALRFILNRATEFLSKH